jgi:hypothetical protein
MTITPAIRILLVATGFGAAAALTNSASVGLLAAGSAITAGLWRIAEAIESRKI